MRAGAVWALVAVALLAACSGGSTATTDDASTAPTTTAAATLTGTAPGGDTPGSADGTEPTGAAADEVGDEGTGTGDGSTGTGPPDASATSRQPGDGIAVVAAAEGVIGWWDGASWRRSETVDVPIAPGDTASFVVAGGPSSTAAVGAVGEGCLAGGGPPGIGLDPEPFPPDPFVAQGVAVVAPWSVAPNDATAVEPDGALVEQLAAALAQRDVVDASPDVVQLLRTDLDGDGHPELLGVAERRTGVDRGLLDAPVGDYSFAFLRIDEPGAVELVELAFWDVVEPLNPSFVQDLVVYRINAVADIDDDGRDEIALHEIYSDGTGVSLVVWQGVDAGFARLLTASCVA